MMLLLLLLVSEDAWLEHRWLDTGLALWREAPLNYTRDYFLPLPNSTLDEVTRRRALYTDSAGFSVGLLSSLTGGDGFALLPAGGAHYWTEHSDRSGASALHWASRSPREASLGAGPQRTMRTLTSVRPCQRTSRRWRRLTPSRPSAVARICFWEEEVLKGYEHHLLNNGLEDEAAGGLKLRPHSRMSNWAPV